MTRTVTAYLGLGANVGERELQIRAALAALAATPGVEVVAVSTLRETEPVGGPEQGKFINGAARLETTLSASALLAICRELERAAGRDHRVPRNHPRALDLDLLLYGDEVIDTAEVVVPHPRMHERSFVIEPLAELGVGLERVPRHPSPRVVRDAGAFADLNTRWLVGGCKTGLVPTMGALHAGHASLFRAARADCDRVAATIFVNPLQFGPNDDYEQYPRDLDHDLEVLRREGVDAVFVPDRGAMYPDGFASTVAVGAEASDLEGAVRSGHFAGVATVVAKLFALARPTRAYFGRKDAQQVAVLRRMVRDLGFPLELVECATLREPDGLAMSSRNVYLSAEERRIAPALYRGLCAARDAFAAGEHRADVLVATARKVIDAVPGIRVEYLELRREHDLRPLPGGPVSSGRLLVAARVGPARLIDNLSLDEE